jgi:chaperonin GroES
MIKPLSDCIVVEQDEEKQGLIIMPTVKLYSGIVVEVGDGKRLPNGTVTKMDVEVGDHIMFGEFTGQKVPFDGKDYLMMRNTEVIGLLNG